MTMLATECSQMVLMQYLPQTTTIYLVERDDAWAKLMMVHLSGINTAVLRPKAPAGLTVLLAVPQVAQIFQNLLRLTKEGAARVRDTQRELDKVDSINNGVDSPALPRLG